MLQQLAKNTTIQVVAKVIAIFVSFILIRLITQTLGKEGYGVYGFVTAVVLLFATIADWGTSIIAVREASKNKIYQGKIFGTALLTRLVLSLVVFVLINVAARTYPSWQEFVTPLTIGSVVLFFLSIKTSILVVFQTYLKFNFLSITEVVGVISFVLLAAFFLAQGRGVNEVILAWVLGTAVAALVAFLLSFRLAKIKLGVHPEIFKKLIAESLPMGMLLLFFSVYNRVDIVILEHFRGVGDVAIYNLAYKIHDNLALGAAFLMSAAFPILSRISGEERKVFYQKIFGLITLGGLVVAVSFFFLSEIVIKILTGDQFKVFVDSVPALKILLFATFISYLNHLTGYSLIAFGKQKTILVIGGVALTFNIVANIIFIPTYSWRAAAVITGITEFIVLVLSTVVIRKSINVAPHPRHVVSVFREIISARGRIFFNEDK